MSIIISSVFQTLLSQFSTFRDENILWKDILAKIEGRETDNITELEGFFLYMFWHSKWGTGWESNDLPRRAELLGGDDLLPSPVELVIVLVVVIIPTESFSSSPESQRYLQHTRVS